MTVPYTVYIDFTPDEQTRYGMSAMVTTLDEEEAAKKETAETAEEDINEGTHARDAERSHPSEHADSDDRAE